MKKSKIALFAFIAVTVMLSTVAGLVSVSSFTSDFEEKSNAALPSSVVEELSALIHEYTEFLNMASEVDAIKETALKNPEFRSQANAFISAFAETSSEIYDILITDNNGEIFESLSDEYDVAESFRDVSNMTHIASTPTPVSGFYEGGKFYVTKSIEKDGDLVGYIVLTATESLLNSYVSDAASAIENGSFTVFDESGNAISSDDEINGALKSSIEEYKTYQFKSQNHESFKRNRNFGTVGSINGTKWRWISLFPAPSVFGAFIRAFCITAAIGLISIIAVFVLLPKFIKKRK